ncbi:unnamed protein product [Alternaria sp. RS040]
MSSTLVIPPPDIRTRIVGMKCRMVLYSHERDHASLNHVDMTKPYDDQYWYIKPGEDEQAGRYLIVSGRTNRALYVNPNNTDDWRIGTFAPIGLKAGQFRLHAPSSDGIIFSRTDNKPGLGCIRISDGVYEDNWFTFELEPLDCVGVEYDVRNAKIRSIQPKSIFSQTSKNDSSAEQKPVITISETTEQQSTFETEAGLEIGVTTSFSCGVPILAEGKVEVSAKVHTNLKWGTTNTTSQSWEASVPLTVPPHTHLRVTATVTQSILEVPFTTTWKSPKTGKTMTTKGIFSGLSSSDLTTNFFPVDKVEAP